MEIKEQVLALVEHFAGGNQSKFARLVGIKPQTLNSWLKRNTMDMKRLYMTFERLSPDWLFTGQGDMVIPEGAIRGVYATTQNLPATQSNENMGHSSWEFAKSALEICSKTVDANTQMMGDIQRLATEANATSRSLIHVLENIQRKQDEHNMETQENIGDCKQTLITTREIIVQKLETTQSEIIRDCRTVILPDFLELNSDK